MKRVAIIDLGTNTFHLLVADIGPGKLNIVYKEKQSVKIGEHGIGHGEIVKAARDRALKTLVNFAEAMKKMEVHESFTIATSAFRNAANGIEFTQEIQQLTGLNINIIDGQREAGLIYLGVKQALDLGDSNALIVDIGGGSVEFIIGNRTEALWSQSYEIGAQRLMDQFHHNDPISSSEIAELEVFLQQRLASLDAATEQYKPSTLVGSSGTFDTLSHIHSMKMGLEITDDPEQPLTIESYQAIHHEIILKNRTERLQIPGMIEMRVDMIVVASSLINHLLNRFRLPEIRVSSYALKEGALMEVMVKNGYQ